MSAEITADGARSAAGDIVPQARPLDADDVFAALREGWEDFKAKPSHVIFLVLLYPVAGMLVTTLAFNEDALPLIFPLVAGFALLGPLTAVGLYELSRRRERGETPSLADALSVATGPAAAPALTIAVALLLVFGAWLAAADGLWTAIIGSERPEGFAGLAGAVASGPGVALIVVGHLVGAVFAAAALAISVFSLPMVVDGERNPFRAVGASIRAAVENPKPLALWGVIVGAVMAVASAPFLVGLAVALPVLGHATWRLYRRAFPRA